MTTILKLDRIDWGLVMVLQKTVLGIACLFLSISALAVLHAEPERVKKLSPQIRVIGSPNQILEYSKERINRYFSKYNIVDINAYEQAPVIFAIEGKRVMAGKGDNVFVEGYTESEQIFKDEGPTYAVIRVLEPLTDGKATLGYKVEVKGVAHLVREGEITVFNMADTLKEVELGDRIVIRPLRVTKPYLPQKPTRPVLTHILSVFGGVTNIALDNVVVIRAGLKQGLQSADLLGVFHGGKVPDEKSNLEPVSLAGKIMILEPYQDISLGVIVEANDYLVVGDPVTNF